MTAKALLLVAQPTSPETVALERLLARFGIVSSRTTGEGLASLGADDNVRLLCSADELIGLLADLDTSSAVAAAWGHSVHSVFVCASGQCGGLEAVARRLTGDDAARVESTGSGGVWQIAHELPEFCGPMSTLRVSPTQKSGSVLRFDKERCVSDSIVGHADGDAFLRVIHRGVPVFLSTNDIVDVELPLRRGRPFDVRDSFLEAVPVVMYVTWAFAETCWRPAVTPACLVVDDPPLWPRYGHLHFDRLLELMEQFDFCTSIAFIPWNWKRSRRRTVDLFARHPSRLSLSIHGCDHTGGEYGETDPERILGRTREAVERMTRHASRTGLPFDKVMVFPQGVFSEAGVAALQAAGFLAAVNTEVTSVDSEAGRISTGDYWDVAVMSYLNFPIFTRRHPSEGIENFAFDILLGKPCLIVLHQGDFHGDAHQVAGFMEQLARLQARLHWMRLADVVRHSVRRRRLSSNEVEVEIYATGAHLPATASPQDAMHVRRRVGRPNAIERILVGARPVPWSENDGQVSFGVDGIGATGAGVTMVFKEPPTHGDWRQGVRSKAIVAARRYLCDGRDQYLMPKTIWS